MSEQDGKSRETAIEDNLGDPLWIAHDVLTIEDCSAGVGDEQIASFRLTPTLRAKLARLLLTDEQVRAMFHQVALKGPAKLEDDDND